MDQWSPALAAQGTASLYGNMLEQVRLAGGKVAGVLWYQGENDTGEEPAVLYPQKFRGLIAKVRDDLGRPELPFYYAQLSRFAGTVTPAYYGAWNQVQEAQRLAETQIPHVGMVATIDLELGDHIHLNQPSLERLGRRFAQAAQGRGGPRLHEVRWVSANELRLRFTGVNGALKAEGGRVFGFEARSPDGNFIPLFHRAFIDPATNEIVFGLNSLKDLPAEMDLWYGRGLDPICNLVDSEDLALPAFGPFRLPALGKIAAKANH